MTTTPEAVDKRRALPDAETLKLLHRIRTYGHVTEFALTDREAALQIEQHIAEALTREVARRREAEARLAEMIDLYRTRNPGPAYIQALGWAVVTFGSIAADERERVMRFVEEAIEVGHAAGIETGVLGRIVDRVYSRPTGDLQLEMAQAGLCLGTLAAKIGLDLRVAEAEEFTRIQAIPKEEWERRHAAKVALGIAADRQGGSHDA